MDNGFGQLLKLWRKRLGLSQMDLSSKSTISAKHISFLETGKSQPSREMVNTLAKAMGLTEGDRNLLLRQSNHQVNESLEPQNRALHALQMVLDKHEPYPGLVSNHALQPLILNQSIIAMLNWLDIDISDFTSIIDLLFSNKGLRSMLVNWEHVAVVSLRLLKLKAATQQEDPLFQASLQKILQNSELLALWEQADGSANGQGSTEPIIPCHIEYKGQTLHIEAILMTYGTPRSVSLEEYQLELFYPVDEASKNFFYELMKGDN